LIEQGLVDGANREPRTIGSVIAELIRVRAASAGAGNRRPLYARMDETLGHGLVDQNWSSDTDPRNLDRETEVRLSRMRLRNWKSFERAELAFPNAGNERTLVVVGGPNGYGKSSILEAYAFGLFGRRAVTQVGSVLSVTSGRGEQRRSYRNLLERTLHRSERSASEGMCAVTLEFATDRGPVVVERKWYFNPDGALIEDDEELIVRIGADRNMLDVPTNVDPQAWCQEEVERRILPAGIAPFLIFDGEEVDRWAQKKLSDQVKTAIGRMLGLEELSGLIADLKDYARDRERHLQDAGGESLSELQQKVARLEDELRHEEVPHAEAGRLLATARSDRDNLISTLSEDDVGTHSSLQSLFEENHRLKAEAAQLDRELIGSLADHGPLLLVGRTLSRSLQNSLATGAGAEAFERLDDDAFDELWARFVVAGPPLDDVETASLRDRMSRAWREEDRSEAASPNHPHLDRRARSSLSTRLDSALTNGRRTILAVAAARKDVGERLAANASALAAGKARLERIEIAKGGLSAAADRIAAAEATQSSIRSRIASLKSQLSPMRDELMRRTAAAVDAGPRLRATAAARTTAAAIEAEIERLAAREYQRFADSVTANFKLLSHKGQVERIEIAPDGAVVILDARGRDITEYRMSAGENQLFAMALIAAVGDIAGANLPLVVDTPLGRLDTKHRGSVLNMLAGRPAQTILLTQPQEIGAHQLTELEPHLALSATLTHALDQRSGVGVSTFADTRTFVHEEAA